MYVFGLFMSPYMSHQTSAPLQGLPSMAPPAFRRQGQVVLLAPTDGGGWENQTETIQRLGGAWRGGRNSCGGLNMD